MGTGLKIWGDLSLFNREAGDHLERIIVKKSHDVNSELVGPIAAERMMARVFSEKHI